MRNDRERLFDILEAIERIERYTNRGREAFEQDELVQTWIVHHIQIIGEAARKLSRNFRSAHSEIPWPEIIAMRNILAHDYEKCRFHPRRRAAGLLKDLKDLQSKSFNCCPCSF